MANDNHQFKWRLKYFDAYAVFREILKLPRNGNSFRQFNQFLCGKDSIDMFNDELSKIEWLTGPHAKPLLKAWIVKNGDH